jgi:hypothetical protein
MPSWCPDSSAIFLPRTTTRSISRSTAGAGTWYASFFLRTCRARGLNWEYKLQMRGGEFSAADQEVLFELVMKQKRRLLREWNEKVCPDRRM